MSIPEKRPPNKPPLENPPIRDVENLASARDCTGLTPAAVRSEIDGEEFSRMYAIHTLKENTLSTGEDK